MKKIFFYIALVDIDEMIKFGVYEKWLIYASAARQLFGVFFSFCVLLYGTSIIFPLWMAIIVTTIIVGILFLIDQAIIGSEWSLYRRYFINRPLNILSNLFLIPFRLMPRICYSIVIAYGIATIAEIGIQHLAIDRVLSFETKDFNGQYLSMIDGKKKELLAHENKLDSKINDLKNTLSAKRFAYNNNVSNKKQNEKINLIERIDLLEGAMLKHVSKIINFSNASSDLQNKVDTNTEKIRLKRIEMDREANDPDRGAKKGPRWAALNNEVIRLETANSDLIPQLKSALTTQGKLISAQSKNNENVLLYKKRVASIEKNEQISNKDTRTIEELTIEIETQKESYVELVEYNKGQLLEYENKLSNGGFFQNSHYGPLDRYIGLKKLYDDKKYGKAAKEFSYGLKLIIILLELSPIFVMLFFSPYSFYSSRMKEKMEEDRTINHCSHSAECQDLLNQLSRANNENTTLKKIRDAELENAETKMEIEINRRVTKVDNDIFNEE